MRIPKPIRLDYLLTINPYAEFEQPSFYHFHLKIILFLQLFRHPGGDIFLSRSDRTIANLYLSQHLAPFG